jgi:thiamine kinase-like enzyme
MNHDESSWQLWLEFIDGVSGLNLTPPMYEQAAYELGRFQGKIYKENPVFLQEFHNLSSKDFLWLEYRQYVGGEGYRWLRSGECNLPDHLRDMIIDMDYNAATWFERIARSPVVFCHQDFWNTNIFVTKTGIRLIDWDTTGWGWLGEDIAALIADDIDIEHMDEYYRRCIPAYYKGLSEYMDVSEENHHVREIILLRFGYRFVAGCMKGKTDEEKTKCLNALQIIYDWGKVK